MTARRRPGTLWSIWICTSSGMEEEKPWMYSSSVFRPMGSTNSWWRSLSGKRTIFVSKLGQYRGPMPSIKPEYMGARSRFSCTMRLVSSVVQVSQHTA